jgi:hypothetical protein
MRYVSILMRYGPENVRHEVHFVVTLDVLCWFRHKIYDRYVLLQANYTRNGVGKFVLLQTSIRKPPFRKLDVRKADISNFFAIILVLRFFRKN